MVPNHQPAILVGPDGVRWMQLVLPAFRPKKNSSQGRRTCCLVNVTAYHGYNHHTLESLTQIQTKGFLVGAIVMERVSVQKNSRTRFTKTNVLYVHCLILFGRSGIAKRLLCWCLLLCHCDSHHGEIAIAQQLFVANGPGQHLAGNPP